MTLLKSISFYRKVKRKFIQNYAYFLFNYGEIKIKRITFKRNFHSATFRNTVKINNNSVRLNAYSQRFRTAYIYLIFYS